MGKYLKIALAAFFVLLLTPLGLKAQDAAVKASIDKDSVLIGDHVTLLLEISLDKSHQFGFPMFKDTIFPGIELVEDLPMDTLRGEEAEIGRASCRERV